MTLAPGWVYLIAVVIKAILIGLVAALLNVEFERALILVAVSAILTGMFALVITLVQARHDRRLSERLARLEDRTGAVAGKLGVDRRETDPTRPSDAPA